MLLHQMQKRPETNMAETDLTNAMNGARETANPPNELKKAQIVCVIGKASFALGFLLTLCDARLTGNF